MRKALAWAAAGTTITAGLLGMAATANAATIRHAPQTPTALSVHESASGFKGHGKVTITGTLAEGRKALGGEAVTLDIVNGRRLVPAGSATTNRSGGVTFTVSPRATATYELVFSGTKTLAGSDSGTVTVRVSK
jgi:hypothetical protein